MNKIIQNNTLCLHETFRANFRKGKVQLNGLKSLFKSLTPSENQIPVH